MESASKISAPQNSPLLLNNVSNISNSKGEKISCDNKCALCRCGSSDNKPFCDGTHIKVNFSSKNENPSPQETNSFSSDNFTILDTPKVCSHAGFCDGSLPNVFWTHENGKRIAHPENESDVEKIKAVIMKCPSGALAFEINGEVLDKYSSSPKIVISKDGPYEIKGEIVLEDDENKVSPNSGDHCALCRCGKSKNKPFCDGTHWHVKFKDESDYSPP